MKAIYLVLSLFITINLYAAAPVIPAYQTQFKAIQVLTLTATPVLVADVNIRRKSLIIQSQCANPSLIKFDSTIASTEGLVLAANSTFEPKIAPYNSIYMKSALGCTVVVYEGL